MSTFTPSQSVKLSVEKDPATTVLLEQMKNNPNILSNSYVLEDSEEQIPAYGSDNLTGSFDDFKDKIEKAIQKTKAALDHLKDRIKNETNEIVEKLKVKLQKELDKYLDKLKEIEDKAKAAGVDIEDCLKDNKPAIENLSKDLGNEIVQCGIDEVNKGLQIVQNGYDEIKRSVDKEEALSKEFKDCKGKSKIKRAKCYAKVTGKMAEAAAKIPITLLKYEAIATAFVDGLTTDLTTCAVMKVAMESERGAALIEAVSKCVEAKKKPQI